MTTLRLLPPATGNATHVANGRTYVGVVGTPQDIPDFDVPTLQANGWQVVEPHGSGTTASRPANPTKGMRFADTTVGASIVFDGKNWRHTITGATV